VKFLIDVNASRFLGNQLIEKGFDVAFVRDINPQMEDETILEWAVRENRIIVTTDNDFEQMIWQRQKSHCGILRLENLPRKQRETLLDDVLHYHDRDLREGKIVIALRNKFRIRKAFDGL
jgi:predicted nuclease of predicted toxin-antitoxin system